MQLPFSSFSKSSLVGLDIGSSSVKAVELAVKSKGKGFELKSLGVAPLPAEAIVQGVFLWATGPLLASFITSNLMEQASIWCFFSIAQISMVRVLCVRA